MVISRASADAPNTFPGQKAQRVHNGLHQERKIIRTTVNKPIEYATPLVKLTRTGTAQSGLQSYTSP